MKELLKGRNVVVVAHPDDETLWCGGLILKNPGDWTIVCLTIPRRDPIRAWKFFTACERLGAKGQLFPGAEPLPNEAILPQIDVSAYNLLVTHGAKGEYGHFHHMCVHAWSEHLDMPKIYFMGNEVVEIDVEAKHHALTAYDHVLPYDTGNVPKWEALEHRYAEHLQGTESFEVAA
jgi:hypothetical protein